VTTVADAMATAVERLEASGCDTPRLDAEVLLAAATGAGRAALIADPGRELDDAQADRFAGWIARRTQREPVAYILGRKAFRHLELHVDRRVLIPRPETEHLVEAALALPRGARVVDVGTGSGAVALALKDERPDLRVAATDSSADATHLAQENARRLDLDVEVLEGDLLEPVHGPIDAVVSNPPYVGEAESAALAPEIVDHEPPQALFAGRRGLDTFRRLISQVSARGVPWVALEVGEGQAGEVAQRLAAAGYARIDIIEDLAGVRRVVVARR